MILEIEKMKARKRKFLFKMLKTALVIMLVLFPAIFGIEEWPEDLHFKYLRSYHGDISCSDNFTECRRRGGERFNLPRVNLMEVK